MRRSVIVFAVMLIMAVAFGLYRMEYLIRDMEQRLAEVNREVLHSHQSIQVLEAEWSYLNQPSRLQRIATDHLELVPLLPSQIGLIGDIPLRDPSLNFSGILDYRSDFVMPMATVRKSVQRQPKTKGKS